MPFDIVRSFALLTALLLAVAAPRAADAQTVGDIVDQALGDAADALAGADAALAGVPPTTTYQASYECSKHQNLVIDGKAFEEGNKLGGKKVPQVIDAHGHCNVLIRNVDMTGIVAIEAHGHANVLIEDSTIRGGKSAFYVHGHANVRVRNSTVVGKKKAFKIHGHANVAVDKKSTVKGKVSTSRFSNYAKAK